MRVLSSKWTGFTRKYSLLAWLVGSALLILVSLLDGAFAADPWKAVNLGFLVVFGVLMNRFTRSLVDSVQDGGDYLLVSRDGRTEQIPIGSIVEVEAGYLVNTGKVVLHLSPVSTFGAQVAFISRYAWSVTGIGATPVAKELLGRAQAARAKSAA